MFINSTRSHAPRVIVHTLWQDDVGVPLYRIRVTDPDPVYSYRQHGRTLMSREAMIPVEFWWNAGRETGVAKLSDLTNAVLDWYRGAVRAP